MRPADEDPQHALAVIDQTLAGEAVAPEDADLAELTLILAGQRPEPRPAFVASLDGSVARRFASPPPTAPAPRRRRWRFAPAGGMLGTAAVIAVLVGTGALTSGNGSSSASSSAAGGIAAPTTSSTPAFLAPPSSTRRPANGSAASIPSGTHAASGAARSGAAASAGVPQSVFGSESSAPAAGGVAPTPPGRQVIHSAQLLLTTRPSQLEPVTQQVFAVVGQESGYVQNSTVTATGNTGSYAQFSLSIPSSNLAATMAALSRLHGAAVVSRSDASQDITSQVGGAGRRLSSDRALRTALLRKLATATSSAEILSLKQQLADVDAAIGRDLAALGGLHHQVDFSSVTLSIQTAIPSHHHHAAAGGFTLGRALHDAGRVLVVAAGVALIALALLIPLGLVAALAAWIAYWVRRRRREQALDLM